MFPSIALSALSLVVLVGGLFWPRRALMKLDIVHGDLLMFNDIIKDAGMSLTLDQTGVRSTYESLLSAPNKLEVARKGLDPDIAATLTCSVCMCIAVNPVVPICRVDRACRCASGR